MANLAFLLEPFPIRNSLGAHGWVGERLCAMLLDASTAGLAVGDMRVVCNEPVMTWLVDRMPAARSYLMQPGAVVRNGFAALVADWHTAGIKTWSEIQRGSPAHEPLYEALLQDVRDSYDFAALGYWGTNETLRTVADRMGVPVLWAEYGPLRPPFPPHFCLDAGGVNGSATSRQGLATVPAGAAPHLSGLTLDMPVSDASAYEAGLVWPADRQQDTEALLRFVRGASRVVLLVMQLADDANILAFGNGWTGETMVSAAIEQLAGPGTVFILRPHPGEAASYHNMVAGEAARALVHGRADVVVFDSAAPDASFTCLSVASEVVCINSSVGFEGLLMGKPVRVLGEASYMPGAAALSADAVHLAEASLRGLLGRHYVPEQRFWTLDFWREAAAQVVPDAPVAAASHLPAVAARGMGKVHDLADGTLVVEGIGSLVVRRRAGSGHVDDIRMNGTADSIHIHGWAEDPTTGGMLAGFLITTAAHSVWCASMQQRPGTLRGSSPTRPSAAPASRCRSRWPTCPRPASIASRSTG